MKRNISLDILKFILALMVVGLHSGFLSDFTEIGHYLTVEGIFRMAVPIFLLVNGYYFYSIIVKKNYIYWFKRVISLYLFWMLFYSYFWFNPIDYSFISFMKLIKQIIIGYFHLWYLPGMIGAAIITIFIKNISLKVTISFILFTFICGVFIQYAGNYHVFGDTTIDKLFNTTFIHRNFLFFAFPFFFIGFFINKFNIDGVISFHLSILLTIIGLFLLITESYLNYINPISNGGFDNYLSLIIISPALFILFMKLYFSSNHGKKIALYSTGIYFIHPMFLSIYRNFFEFEGTLLTLVVAVSSILATYFLIKINDRLKFIL